MKKISVVCASPAKPNPGMASVDLAFHCLNLRRRLAEKVEFYQLYTAEEIHAGRKEQEVREIVDRQRLPFEYRCARGRLDEIHDSDLILFWGDFLHMAQYQRDAGRRLLKFGAAAGEDEALAAARRLFFLSGAPEGVLGKSMAYGGTLLFNTARNLQDPNYRNEAARFFGGARKVWMRDVYSALQVDHVLETLRRGNLGGDCSLFLRPEDLEGLPRSDWSGGDDAGRGKVGVFFGRSDCSPRLLGKFARALCKSTGAQAEWLPWGMKRGFKGMLRKVSGAFPGMDVPEHPGAPLLGDLYARLGNYRLVISDTYHVCVNAWRLGTPAICVGQAVSDDPWSVNSGPHHAWRDKRQVFYSMYDAMDYYTYVEELADRTRFKKRLAHMAEILTDQGLQEMIVSRIHRQRDQLEEELVSEINMVLEK